MDPVARRYAQALYQEARQASQAEAVDADVQVLGETLDDSRELELFFESPIVSREKKEAVLQQLFAGRVSDLTMQFVALLVEKQRETLVPAIVRAYRDLRDQALGIVEAQVRTATPLSPAEVDALKAALEGRTGKTVRMRLDVDPSLVGGLVVRLGDVVYDRSVRHQLDTLREQLSERAALSLN